MSIQVNNIIQKHKNVKINSKSGRKLKKLYDEENLSERFPFVKDREKLATIFPIKNKSNKRNYEMIFIL